MRHAAALERAWPDPVDQSIPAGALGLGLPSLPALGGKRLRPGTRGHLRTVSLLLAVAEVGASSGGQRVCQGESDPREQVLPPGRGSLPSDGWARAGAGQGWLRQVVLVSRVCRGKAGCRHRSGPAPGLWSPRLCPTMGLHGTLCGALHGTLHGTIHGTVPGTLCGTHHGRLPGTLPSHTHPGHSR